MVTKQRHPAKFSKILFPALMEGIVGSKLVLDPFAGTGLVHDLAASVGAESVGIELEPEWATMHPKTVVGDATALPFSDNTFDTVLTSPVYGNRMSDHHEAKDASFRNTYRHTLGRPLHPNNAGQLQWGDKYRDLHERAWAEVDRVLIPGGIFVLNVSNHIRKGKEIEVSEWHRDFLINKLGFTLLSDRFVETPRQRFGENAQVRVTGEHVYVFVGRG